MLVDWFTVVAQAINFLILIGLLRWLLYRRIIEAMDQREAKVVARLAEAESQRKEAQRQAAEFQQKQIELKTQREAVLGEAHEQANQHRKELLMEARQEVDERHKEWHKQVESEKEDFLRNLRNHTTTETLALTRQILGEMADTSLEKRMAHELARRLSELDAGQKKEIAHSIQRFGKQIILRSAFDLPASGSEIITQALAQICPDVNVQYEVEPELICGIELEAGGYKIGWSFDDYLRHLEEKVQQMLTAESHENT